MSSTRKLKYLTLILFMIIGCKNPFSPAYDQSGGSSSATLSDLKTIEGVFKNFQYAYTFKDTLIYGELISQDFIFTYRDYDLGYDVSWGRDEEMKSTYGLFQNTQRLDLIWNNIFLSSEDSVNATIIRGFNLTVTLSPTDIPRIDGKVNMVLKKNPETQKWAIARWNDQSNY